MAKAELDEHPAPRPGGWRLLPWFAVFFLSFDILLFRFLFWQLPNESGWAELPYYNFEYRARELANTAPDPAEPTGRPLRVLFVGSSLAMYSVLPEDLSRNLSERLGRPVEVKLLSHQGMPSETKRTDRLTRDCLF